MKTKVREYIKKHEMICRGDRILAGVSGGADSVCLLRILAELQGELEFHLEVVHIHHGIRGQEADRDMRFVEKLCSQQNIPFYTYRFDVPSLAKAYHMSEEETGRFLRYKTFREHLGNSEGKIAVAHHREDNAETILLQMFRGSGIKGMCGMAPVNGVIIRPFLCVSRQEIESYLSAIGQDYCEDATNASVEYARNRVRQRILPEARRVNEAAVSHILSLAGELGEAEEYLARETDIVWKELAADDFLPERLLAYPTVLQKRVVRKAIEQQCSHLKDIGRVHVEQVLTLFEKEVGKEAVLPGKLRATREYGGISFGRLQEETEPVPEDFAPIQLEPGTYELPDGNCFRISVLPAKNGDFCKKNEKDSCVRCFDYGKIKDTVCLRTRRAGDYLVIHRDGSRKKLKDYLIDEKIPQRERDALLLFAAGSEVLWIPGMRSSSGMEPDESTVDVLKIEWKGGAKR